MRRGEGRLPPPRVNAATSMTTRTIANPRPEKVPWLRFMTAPRVGACFRAAVLFAVTGASLALSVQEAIGRRAWLDDFLTNNTLPLGQRNDLLFSMAGAAFVFAASPMLLVLRYRSDAVIEQVRALALALSPLALAAMLVPLFRTRPWQDRPLALGCAIALLVLGTEKTLAQALTVAPVAGLLESWTRWTPPRATRYLPVLAAVTGALAYGVFVTFMTIRYHHRLGTAAYDLGGYDNLFYNALHGHPLRGTVAVPSGKNWSSLRTHAEFAIYVFLPFYALSPRAEALLCIQAFMVGAGAIPVYLLAAKRIPRAGALALAAAYLLFAPIHSGNFYDFHFQPLGSTLILWSFYFLDAKKNVLFGLCAATALACREDMSISLAIVGVLMIGAGYRPRLGLLLTVISGTYFAFVRFYLMPHFGSWWFQDMYKDLLPAGDSSLIGVLKTVFSNPLYTLGTLLTLEKLLHVVRIFLPLAFLPLRRPCLWPGFVPAVLTTVLTTGYHPTTDTTFQYIFSWVPFIFLGAILALERIRREAGPAFYTAAVGAMAVATLITSYQWGVVFQRQTFASAWGHIDLDPLTQTEREQLASLRELGAMVPHSASLALSENEVPQLSNRLDVYTLKTGAENAAYVLYRKDSGNQGADQAADLLARGEYEQVKELGKFVLLKRAGPPK
jgi:uncharacterized membrane protein